MCSVIKNPAGKESVFTLSPPAPRLLSDDRNRRANPPERVVQLPREVVDQRGRLSVHLLQCLGQRHDVTRPPRHATLRVHGELGDVGEGCSLELLGCRGTGGDAGLLQNAEHLLGVLLEPVAHDALVEGLVLLAPRVVALALRLGGTSLRVVLLGGDDRRASLVLASHLWSP